MKKKLTALLCAALAAMLLLSACGGGKTATKMTMGTGGSSGTYYLFGGALATVINDKTDVEVTVVSTDGSKDNLVNIGSGTYQLGTVQNDVMSYAYEGTNTFAETGAVTNFRVIGALYNEQIQIITVDPTIESVADLAGKTVSIGAAASGVYFNAVQILAAYGLTENDINAVYQSFADSAESLKDGKIDAAFITAGAPTTAVSELANSKEISLVEIDDAHADALIAECPYYTKTTIAADVYGTASDTQTVTVKATLVVSADASEDDVYAITKAMFETVDDIAHAKKEELSLESAVEGISVPFHSGAAKYYAEQGITVPTE
jgi:hypothetical protein